MKEYLEENDNLLIQLFAEFATFVYLSTLTAHNNELLDKILLDSKRIHIRMLYDFFTLKEKDKKGRRKDDLSTMDFLAMPVTWDIYISSELRRLTNKSAAHLTKARGTISVPRQDYIDASKSIILSISEFMRELDHGNMNDKCKYYYKDENVISLKETITKLLCRFADLNNINKVIDL